MENKPINISLFLYLIFLLLQSISMISNAMLCHVVFAVWLFSVFIFNRGWSIGANLQKKYWALFVFVVFYFLSSGFGANLSIAFHRLFVLLEVLSPFLFFDIVKPFANTKVKKTIVFVFTIVIIIDMIAAFKTIGLTEGFGLRLTQTDIALKNNFAFVYSLTIICPALVYFDLLIYRGMIPLPLSKGWAFSLISIVLIITASNLIFKSLFMTAIVLLIMGIILAFFYGKKRWLIKSGLSILLTIVAFIVSFNGLVQLSNSREGFSTQVTPKLYEIRAVLSGNTSDASDYSSRQDLQQSSMAVFFENPIFGVFHKTYDFSDSIEIGVGNHSEWMDMLARYGIFSLFLMYFIFYSFWQCYKDNKMGLHILLFVVLGFLNPIFSFLQFFTIMIYIPFIYDILLSLRVHTEELGINHN